MAAIAGPVLGGIASAGAAKLLSGSGPKIPNISANVPKSVNTPGLNIVSKKGGLTATRTAETTGLLEQLGLINKDQAARLGGLIEQVKPGVGALTEARLTGLGNVRRRTIGDIRENLARRRVLGSSFAQDAITRAEREFAEQEAELRASSFLQELELTNQLSQQQADALRSTVLTGLEQSNFEAQLAVNFANRTQAVMGQIGQFQAQLSAQAQSGLGAFFQPAISAIGGAVSQGVQSLFQPTGTVFNAPNTASP